jgi:hypothetical protein
MIVAPAILWIKALEGGFSSYSDEFIKLFNGLIKISDFTLIKPEDKSIKELVQIIKRDAETDADKELVRPWIEQVEQRLQSTNTTHS